MRRSWAILLPVLLASCISDPKESLDTKTWATKKAGLASFSYKLSRPCFCLPEDVGPFLVRATPDSVLEVRRIEYPSDTFLVTEEIQSYSIDSAIAQVAHELAKKHASATLRYDSTYGFPEHVYIDFNTHMADEEYALDIADFEATLKD